MWRYVEWTTKKLLDFFDAQLSTESIQQPATGNNDKVYLSYIMHNINYADVVTTDLGLYTVSQCVYRNRDELQRKTGVSCCTIEKLLSAKLMLPEIFGLIHCIVGINGCVFKHSQ